MRYALSGADDVDNDDNVDDDEDNDDNVPDDDDNDANVDDDAHYCVSSNRLNRECFKEFVGRRSIILYGSNQAVCRTA